MFHNKLKGMLLILVIPHNCIIHELNICINLSFVRNDSVIFSNNLEWYVTYEDSFMLRHMNHMEDIME